MEILEFISRSSVLSAVVWRVELRLPCRTMLRAHCREFSSDSLTPPPLPLTPSALPNIVQLYSIHFHYNVANHLCSPLQPIPVSLKNQELIDKRIWRDHLTGDGRALTRVELPATTEQ
uniref:Uncharacterized protein n=1 Tax=Timema cristinae TaxID=61476 RepID=A0A7R9GW32_TIMCR|nr:unnamed protein product [Timema cristinae]